MILEGGMKLEQDTPDAGSTAMVESRTFQVEEICRWFGVPPHKVQHLMRATFNNIEHLGLEFTRDALVPWAKRLEQEADFKLFSDRGPRRSTKLDTTWLSQGDNESRAKAAVSWRSAGVKTANEIRHEEGLNPLTGPEGDVVLVGSGMKTIKTVLKEEEQVGKQPALKALPPGAQPEDPEKDGEEDASKTKQEGDKAKKAPKPATDRVQQVVRDAAVALFASAIDRYNRRLSNRQADLERHGHTKDKVLENLSQEKDRLRPWLIKECERAVAIVKQASGGSTMDETDILVAADAVDNGETPHVAAERLVSTYFAATEVARG
jgi:hypothetical protein